MFDIEKDMKNRLWDRKSLRSWVKQFGVLPEGNIQQEDARPVLKEVVSEHTDSYIQRKLSEIDEDLADITSETQVIEGRILYLAAKENVSITTDEVKQKIALSIAGSYTEQDAVNELKEKGFLTRRFKRYFHSLQEEWKSQKSSTGRKKSGLRKPNLNLR